MKLLFVTEYFPPKIMGGGEINLYLLAKKLAKKDIKVHVLTSYFKGLKKYEKKDDINIHRRLKTATSPSGIINNLKRSLIFPNSTKNNLKIIIKQINPNIIHFIGTAIIASDVAKKLNKKCFATIESYPTLCPKGDLLYKGKNICNKKCTFSTFVSCFLKSNEVGKTKNSTLLKYNPKFWIYLHHYYKKLNSSLKNCNLIAISEFIKNRLKKEGYKSKVIPNVIELNKFYNKKINNKKTNILYVGSLTKYKGPQILLEASKDLDCHIDIYGEGPMKKELEKIINKNRLDAIINNNIPYEKIPEVYSKTDIVVFPSIWPEPFGRISVEAMASEKTIVASRVGAISETVKDNGFLFEPGNIKELNNILKKLMNNKKLRNNIAKKGKIYVKKYSAKKTIKDLIKYYKKK